MKKWLDEEYPAIAAKAKAEGGEIHWGDETALVNTQLHGRSYAPKGETPVALAPGSRQKLSMISTVTNKGEARWMIIDGNFNADRLIEFLEALIKDATKKVFLILDNLRAHHSKPVIDWLAERTDRIEVFYLPSYAPELNPDERLRYEARHRSQGPGADEIETESRRRGPHDRDREIPRQGSRLLQRPESEVCRIETSPDRINSEQLALPMTYDRWSACCSTCWALRVDSPS